MISCFSNKLLVPVLQWKGHSTLRWECGDSMSYTVMAAYTSTQDTPHSCISHHHRYWPGLWSTIDGKELYAEYHTNMKTLKIHAVNVLSMEDISTARYNKNGYCQVLHFLRIWFSFDKNHHLAWGIINKQCLIMVFLISFHIFFCEGEALGKCLTY